MVVQGQRAARLATAVALLLGGNEDVQSAFWSYFPTEKESKFFFQMKSIIANAQRMLDDPVFLDGAAFITPSDDSAADGDAALINAKKKLQKATHVIRIVQLLCEGQNTETALYLVEHTHTHTDPHTRINHRY